MKIPHYRSSAEVKGAMSDRPTGAKPGEQPDSPGVLQFPAATTGMSVLQFGDFRIGPSCEEDLDPDQIVSGKAATGCETETTEQISWDHLRVAG
jgi:hypothetical protein